MSAFPTVSKSKKGYSKSEVDAFLAKARDQYSNLYAQVLDWRQLHKLKFELEKGGYEPAAVDSAIDKLQDTFAERELKNNAGFSLIKLRSDLASRTVRPKGRRFQKAKGLALGYSPAQVDKLMKLVSDSLDTGEALELNQVRSARFKTKRGGYVESQVDAYLDRVIEYLQALRLS